MKKIKLWALTYPALLVALSPSATALQGNEWYEKAVEYQKDIQKNIPLSKVQVPSTHNSYNSSVYSVNDPNHSISLSEQLDMGVRNIEIDIHDNVVCHAPNCWIADERLNLRSQLQEIGTWLSKEKNDNELVTVYIEDFISPDYYADVSVKIEQELGDYLYKQDSNPNGCANLDLSLTPQQILDSGANLILLGEACTEEKIISGYNRLVFSGAGLPNIKLGDSGYGFDGSSKWFEPSDNDILENGCQFDETTYNTLWVRVSEDRRGSAKRFGFGDRIYRRDVKPLENCGVNLLSLDKNNQADLNAETNQDNGRLYEQIWSWGENQPSPADGYGAWQDCGMHNQGGKFEDWNCISTLPASCKDPLTGNWFITQTETSFYGAKDACHDEAPEGYQFDLPINAFESHKLLAAKQASGIGNSWIYYNDLDQEGKWLGRADLEQEFTLKRHYFSLVNNDKCLKINSSAVYNNAPVSVGNCTLEQDQLWYYDVAKAQLRSKTAANYCLNNRGITSPGAGATVWSCFDSDNLKWDWLSGGKLANRHDNSLVLTNNANGQAVQAINETSINNTWDIVYEFENNNFSNTDPQPKEILVAKYTNDFRKIWDESGSGADDDVSIWRANLPAGYQSLGDFSHASHSYPRNSVLIIKDHSALSKPISYKLIWKDNGSGADDDVSLWMPIAQPGHSCLGHLATSGAIPNRNEMRCIDRSYLQDADSFKVWDDSGSGAHDDVSLWSQKSKASEKSVITNSFIARRTFAGSGDSWRHQGIVPSLIELRSGSIETQFSPVSSIANCIGVESSSARTSIVLSCDRSGFAKTWNYNFQTGAVKSIHNGLCLASQGVDQRINLQTCADTSSNQQWQVDNNGKIRSRAESNICWEYSSTDNYLWSRQCSSSNQQAWTL